MARHQLDNFTVPNTPSLSRRLANTKFVPIGRIPCRSRILRQRPHFRPFGSRVVRVRLTVSAGTVVRYSYFHGLVRRFVRPGSLFFAYAYAPGHLPYTVRGDGRRGGERLGSGGGGAYFVNNLNDYSI